MLKKLLFIVLFVGCAVAVFAQERSRLAILPFEGGSVEDGRAIAMRFSIQNELMGAFTILPRDRIDSIIAEQNFQMSGYTDSDSIASIGSLLNAEFVVSGHLRRLGELNIIIISIINVKTFELLAGYYHDYRVIEDIPALLPEISKRIINASRRNSLRLPKLAVAPFNVAGRNVNVQDAETLAQILAVEIANTDKYAVLPRTSTMQTAMKEQALQMSGLTSDKDAVQLGKAINAEYVLAADVSPLGNINTFIARILHVEGGNQIAVGSRDYRVIDDGIKLMPELALLLTDRNATAKIAALNRERARAAMLEDPTKFWSMGASVGTSFAAPWVIGTVSGTIAPFKNSFFEVGFDFGMASGVADVKSYYSLYPYAHCVFFLPLPMESLNIGWYAGAGGGYMIAEYAFPEGDVSVDIFALDVTTGVNIGNFINIAYTLRTNFKSANNKLVVGYTYRFK